jgi:hypothetical protein
LFKTKIPDNGIRSLPKSLKFFEAPAQIEFFGLV